jgi:hypothetical protein
MKDLVIITTPADIHDYVRALWKTDVFRHSHQPGHFIFDVIDQFAKVPRGFCETTNDYLERAHFCTWWNVHMHRRDYANPYIEDLYRLHEIYHAATLPYLNAIGYEAFHRKMEDNELKASVASEIRAYFEMPELRHVSFAYEIYADRYLRNPDMQVLWRENKGVAIETLQEARRDVMFSKPEHEMDFPERWIRRFTIQNRQWSTVWYERYQEVENHMWQHQMLALNGKRKEAAARHQAWLDQHMADDPAEAVPFRQEAALFAGIYWANRRKYEEAVKAAGPPSGKA